MPFGNESLTLSNLVYLNAEQALADLAYFTIYVRQNNIANVPFLSSWVVIGGSYPGALSAWYRSKYPHLSVGAIGSSGVILAIEEFDKFDEQIYISTEKSGDWCPARIVEVADVV